MGKGKYEPSTLDRARDELFSHIQRCGVLEAEGQQQTEWLEDTLEYLAERYPDLSGKEMEELRTMGQRYCSPAIPHGKVAAEDVWEDEGEDKAVEAGGEPTEVGAV